MGKAGSRPAASRRLGKANENASYYLMIAPFLILFFLFTVLPVLSSIVLSFFNYDMISMPKFTGLENYLRMVDGDEVFPKAIVNTLKFAVITGPLSFYWRICWPGSSMNLIIHCV